MENRLTGGFTTVEDEPVLAVRVLGREIGRRCDDLGQKIGITLGEFGDVAILGRLRDDKQVNGCLGRNIPECDQALIFEHDVRRNRARDNELEDGGLCR